MPEFDFQLLEQLRTGGSTQQGKILEANRGGLIVELEAGQRVRTERGAERATAALWLSGTWSAPGNGVHRVVLSCSAASSSTAAALPAACIQCAELLASPGGLTYAPQAQAQQALHVHVAPRKPLQLSRGASSAARPPQHLARGPEPSMPRLQQPRPRQRWAAQGFTPYSKVDPARLRDRNNQMRNIDSIDQGADEDPGVPSQPAQEGPPRRRKLVGQPIAVKVVQVGWMGFRWCT